MRNLVFALAFIAAGLALGGHARASCATSYPYGPPTYLTNGVTADASTLWADLQDVRTCATTVDNTQIGPLGVFASQIIPTTVAQATFGGTTAYTFPAGLNITGTLLVNGGAVPSVTSANVWTANQTVSGGWISAGPSTGALTLGDVEAARSTTTGAFVAGGVTESMTWDYNVTHPHGGTFTCVGTNCTTQLYAGGSLAPFYTTSGASTAAAHNVFISTTTAGSTSTCGDAGTQYCSTVTLTGAAFSAYNSYICHTNVVGAAPSMGEYYGAVTTGYGESHASGSTIKFWSASPSQAMVAVCTGT